MACGAFGISPLMSGPAPKTSTVSFGPPLGLAAGGHSSPAAAPLELALRRFVGSLELSLGLGPFAAPLSAPADLKGGQLLTTDQRPDLCRRGGQLLGHV